MKVENYCNSYFWEIPEKENPAFGKEECYMVVKDYGIGRYTNILHIQPNPNPMEQETVTSICKCCDSNQALEIAELLANCN